MQHAYICLAGGIVAGFCAGWLAHRPAPPDPEQVACASMAAIAPASGMMERMPSSDPAETDRQFVKTMIPHKYQAVVLAEHVMEHGEDPDLRVTAESIIRLRQNEIEWMRGWLREHEGTSQSQGEWEEAEG